MGTGNIDVGNKSPTRKTGQPIIERLFGTIGFDGLRLDTASTPERQDRCGAMAQQCDNGSHGNQSAPQGLVRLVGCREIKVRSQPPAYPGPVKRPGQE